MKVAITDANIFIDLFEIGKLEWLGLLGLDIYTTDVVLNELSEIQGEAAQRVITVLKSLSYDDISNLSGLQVPRGLSEADRSVIWQTQQLSNLPFLILSGDNLMRKWCVNNKIEVHGILWIFDVLIDKNHIKYQDAYMHLSRLMEINQWLPLEECESRLKEWGKYR